MLGIVIGVASVITMIAIGRGAQERINEQIRSLGSNLLVVQPGAQASGGARLGTGTQHTLTEGDAAAIARDIDSIGAVAPSVQRTAQLVRSNLNWSTMVIGAVPDHFVARDWSVESGRLFGREDVAQAAKVAVLGASVRERLFEHQDPVGAVVRINRVPFTIVGVLERKGHSPFGRDQDDITFVPLSTAKLRLFGGAHEFKRQAVDFVYAKVGEARAMADAKLQIEVLLRRRHRIPRDAEDDFLVRDLASLVSTQREASQTFSTLLAAVASVSLMVGGIGIMNIMLVSVTERIGEIGVRRAVGACRRDIRNQFLLEAITICLVGSWVGVALGIVTAHALAAVAGWTVSIETWSILVAVAFAAAVGVCFGSYPAIKASRLEPINALRYE
jgi:putative ABC transport system permease protein